MEVVLLGYQYFTMIGQAFHWANLALAFLLELCA